MPFCQLEFGGGEWNLLWDSTISASYGIRLQADYVLLIVLFCFCPGAFGRLQLFPRSQPTEMQDLCSCCFPTESLAMHMSLSASAFSSCLRTLSLCRTWFTSEKGKLLAPKYSSSFQPRLSKPQTAISEGLLSQNVRPYPTLPEA